MSSSINRRQFASSALAAALWLLFAVGRWLLSQLQGSAVQLAGLVPEVVPSQLMGTESSIWVMLGLLVGAVSIALVHASLISITARGTEMFVPAWFATVAAGAVVGLALDLAAAADSIGDFGLRGLLVGDFGAAAASGALWGLGVGWMVGLVARTPAHVPGYDGRPATPRNRPRWLAPAASVSVVAVLLSGLASDAARTAAIEAEVAARQEAEAATTFGALPDPEASGVPVPDRVDAASAALDPEWCTPDKATVLKGEPDAATGHRAMTIRLMNFSDESCVIEGYPDVAFGDQNQHLLDVTIEHGGSFMTHDPGSQRIEIPAGGYAVTVLGWDAASPHGALVTKTVYAAPTAGMPRGSWPIDLDIVEGSTVAVTAWMLDAAPESSD
ncbi:DUF4232 domain-containing protein [Microbacterium fluvii]|uniref:DUF4232 domain-containing protein n=1 Tax=Microbacterium fluvii TaxID=415215 RepID=A0ABW2HIZ7_9MICO|nr:DUF4232 domain-containing protein [Microbacterium fluvii]MCU4673574.1 DUF4232 domain-containing protein [Microbacterium fluvii]